MLTIIIISCLTNFIASDSIHNEQLNEIAWVGVRYVFWDSDTFIPLKCDELTEGYLLLLKDRDFFQKLDLEINKLQKNDKVLDPDARILLIIHYVSGKEDQVCIGKNKVILLNKKNMKYSEEIEKLARSMIPLSYFLEIHKGNK